MHAFALFNAGKAAAPQGLSARMTCSRRRRGKSFELNGQFRRSHHVSSGNAPVQLRGVKLARVRTHSTNRDGSQVSCNRYVATIFIN